jgi:rSAM/selenodomain-associated transferase 2
MHSRLSIVMPVLNEAGRVAATLAALAPLRAQGAELIVVDGGSDDGTRALCSAGAHAADVVLTATRGRAQQMNAGARAASGTVLLFLHADTVLPDAAAALIAQALASGRHGWGRFDVAIAGHSRLLPLIAALMNLRSRLTGIATGDQAIFVRRDRFDAVGGYPEQPLMEDIELSRRLRRLGAPACLRAEAITSGRRWEQRGVWRTIFLMWRLRLLYWLGVPAERLAAAYR